MTHALYVAWRGGDGLNGRWAPIGRLERDLHRNTYVFQYTRGALELEGFLPLTGMSDLHGIYESDSLFPVFANRLLPRSRSEYEAYLSWGGFEAGAPDPIVLLGVTEGRRQTDRLEMFPAPTPQHDGTYANKFFVHGVRWMTPEALRNLDRLQPGEPLGLMVDYSNTYDRNAVALRTLSTQGRFLLGYVPRYLAADVRKIALDSAPETVVVNVERVNRDAPLQQRLLCIIRSSWPQGFRPCSGPHFEPIGRLMQRARSETLQAVK